MKQDHRPWKPNDFKGGANTDADGVVIAGADGVYRDARNMRLVDNQGNNGTLTKIGGEQAFYVANVPGPETYTCIGCILVKNRVIEFWASNDPDTHMPFMRVDGEVMVQSADLPYKFDKPLQLHKMEDCEGGMVFDARSGDVPLHWDIGDIMAEYAADNQTYFSGLSITAYQANLLRPVNRPVFTGITDIGAGSGMYPGQYGYTTRLVNANGDHTPDGPPLESVMIPLLSDDAPNLPTAGVVGSSVSGLAQRTKWGAKLKFRVNNKANMAWVEVVRSQYILDGGIDQLVDIVIAARFPLDPGQNEVMYFTDNGDHVGEISTDASLILTHYINSANSVRYIDYRLVYGGVELGKKTVNGVYDGTTKTFPVTRKLGIRGHSDPANNCYKRRFQSGERYAVGNVFWLPDGSTSDVDFIEEVQLPNRRDPKTGDSLTWSDAPIYAATTDVQNTQGNGKVGPTFEVFDHDNATAKQGSAYSEENKWVNVMEHGVRLDSSNSPSEDIATDNSPWVQGVTYPDGGGPSGVKKTVYGIPLRPATPSDWKVGLDYKVNTGVRNEHDGSIIPYAPKVFNVQHHTLALALRGVSHPTVAQGFSLVTSKPANRVVTQGLAHWRLVESLNEADYMASKDQYTLDVGFPDYEGGVLSQADIDAISNGSAIGNYQVQFVAPLGIASEQYASVMMWENSNQRPLGFLADMMSYARVQWDKGQINPGTTAGIVEPQPNGADNFVGFGQWRNGMGDIPWNNGADGNLIMNISAAQNLGNGRIRLTFDRQIYGQGWGGSGNFDEVNTMNFHEPWYVVNIIREGLHPDRLGGYVSCNHYQAYTSEIGVTATQNQQFLLADENLDMVQGRVNDGIERYIYLRTTTSVLRYMNMEGMSTAQYTQALLTQASQGYFNSPFTGEQVEGLFSVGQDSDDTFIKMDSYVPFGAIVEVRYDKRIPAIFYGDRVTAPSLATVVNGYGDVNGYATTNPFLNINLEANTTGVGFLGANSVGGTEYLPTRNPYINSDDCLVTHGLGIPFRNYVYNNKYMVPFGKGDSLGLSASQNAIVNQFSNATIHSVRQWIALFDCEVKSPLHLSQYDYPAMKTFPQVNYRPAPYSFSSAGFGSSNGIFGNYVSIYGSTPGALGRGGFSIDQLPVSPYRVAPRVKYYERPPNLGEEITNLCDALIYSEKYSPVVRNLPGLKTFPQDNIYFIENDTGAIQRLYSYLGDLCVLTETGVYLALIHKNLMYSPDGSSQNIYATLDFIGSVTPRSKAIGMPGDWWRTAAEGPILADSGQRTDSLMWFDGTSQYRLTSGSVIDIAKGRYRKGLADASFVPSTWTFPVRKCGVYDKDKDELYTGLFSGTPLYAFSPQTNQWYGTTDHQYDNMLWTPKGMMGMRDGITYALDNGQILNGKPVQGWVKVASAPYPNERMWFRRIKVDSVRKPTRIEFYDENDVLVAWMDEATFGPHYLLKETAWEHWVPMDRVSIAPKKKAIQGRLAYAKMMFQDPGEDKVAFSGMLVVPVK